MSLGSQSLSVAVMASPCVAEKGGGPFSEENLPDDATAVKHSPPSHYLITAPDAASVKLIMGYLGQKEGSHDTENKNV